MIGLSTHVLVRSQVVQALLQTKEIQVENAEVVWRAVRLYRASAAVPGGAMREQ